MLRAGDCAAFPKSSGNGHHFINKSDAMTVYLEIDARSPTDFTVCSDIDMVSSNADARFVHKDGAPYPDAYCKSARPRKTALTFRPPKKSGHSGFGQNASMSAVQPNAASTKADGCGDSSML